MSAKEKVRQESVKPVRFMKRKEVTNLTGYCIQQLGRLEKEGKFPRRLRIGKHRVVWLAHEVEAWMKKWIEERDRGEGRELDRAA